MYALKIVTTVFVVMLMLIILSFSKGMKWKKDKAAIIGFGYMQISYILCLICMWV